MTELPEIFNDIDSVLTKDGFSVSPDGVWYHGTSSALVDSIKQNGLNRSGDSAINQAAKNTMATIGNSYTEQREPVFLTQSKALAYFWAQQCVRRRQVRFGQEETPAVIELKLDKDLHEQVRPDVGAASLLMLKEGEEFMAFVAGLFERAGAGYLDIDLRKANRDEYLSKLGMAYLDLDVSSSSIEAVI